jgi:hypothetical protein
MLNLLPLGDNPKRFIKVICKMIIKGLSMKYVSVEKVVSMGGLTCQLKTLSPSKFWLLRIDTPPPVLKSRYRAAFFLLKNP